MLPSGNLTSVEASLPCFRLGEPGVLTLHGPSTVVRARKAFHNDVYNSHFCYCCCCHQISDKKRLTEGRVCFGSWSDVRVHHDSEKMVVPRAILAATSDVQAAGLSAVRRGDECSYPDHRLLFLQSETPALGIMPPTFKVGLSLDDSGTILIDMSGSSLLGHFKFFPVNSKD